MWCYLAGSRTVTFASGHRTMRSGGRPEEAGWQIVCRQAEIERK